MKQFRIEFSCDECSKIHPTKLVIPLKDGPTQRKSILESYQGKEFPTAIKMLDDFFKCPETGKHTIQGDKKKLFLVPL